MKNNLPKPILTLFMTEGLSLKYWDEIGMIERELFLYNRLSQLFSTTQLFTYGSRKDKMYETVYPNIKVLPWYFPIGRLLQKNLGLWIHYNSLKQSNIFKTNQISGSLVAVKAKQIFNKPLIIRCGRLWSVFSELKNESKETLKKVYKTEKIAFNYADLVFVTCDRDKNEIIKRYNIKNSKIKIIPNYVDTTLFKPSIENHHNQSSLLFIGRLVDQKNLNNLFEAVEKVEQLKKLVIVGDGDKKDELKQISKKMNTKVEFLGVLSSTDLPSILNKYEKYILPSKFEGMPKTLLEAMSTGRACIGSDVIGINNIIDNQKDGLLCGTDVDGIASSINKLFKDDNLRENIKKNARKKIIEQYSIDIVAEKELSYYKLLLEN